MFNWLKKLFGKKEPVAQIQITEAPKLFEKNHLIKMPAALISGKHETIIFAFLMRKKCKCEKALDRRNPTIVNDIYNFRLQSA